jgi:hypothetical protein
MLEQLLYLVIYLMVLGLVAWLLLWVVDQIPLPQPFHQIIRVVIIVFCCIAVIYLLLGLVGGAPRLGRL